MRVAPRPGKRCRLAAALAGAWTAEARVERQVSHRFERVWPTAVRFLRVDQGYPIREKDAGVGYVLFDVEQDGKSFRGSLELVRARDSQGRRAVKIILHVEDRPQYVERMIMDRLLAKIRDEHGDPPPAPKEDEKEKGEEGKEEEAEGST